MTSLFWLALILAILSIEFIFELILGILNSNSRKQSIPSQLKDIYSDEKYLKMQAYHDEHDKLGSIQSILSFSISLLVLITGAFGFLSDYIFSITQNPWYHILLFFAIIGGISSIVSIPFGIYKTFVIEEKYGFNKTTLKTFILDIFKGLFVSVIIILPLSWVLLYVYEMFNFNFWWIAFLVLFSFSLFMAMFYTSFLLPIFNKLSPLQDGELKTAIQEYCAKNGFKLNNLFVMDGSKRSTKANAFFSGLGPKKSIVLYDTLVNNYSIDEIVSVLAHEVGHYKKKHIFQSLILGAITLFITFFILSFFLDNTVVSNALGANIHSLGLAILGFGMIYSPISFLFGIFANLLSRKNEYEADNFAKKTYQASSLISALKKLFGDSFSNLTPNKFYVFFNYSHPTLLQRINNLENE